MARTIPGLALLAGLFCAATNAAWGQPVPVKNPPASQAAAAAKKASIEQPEDTLAAFWARVPPLRPMSRIGYFLLGPTGPGYYSLLDWILDEPRPTRPRTPYPPVSGDGYSFYDADYRYLENPNFGQVDFLSPLKRIHPGEDWLLSFGGEERVRYMDENGGYARFTGQANVYELIRSRVYADVWYRDWFRVYTEMQDSRIANNDLPPLPNDVDHDDFLNLFADAKLFSLGDRPAYVRFGRQELYFGSQRLIGPSDFPNVRRTFQGVRAFWLGKDWNVDAFWVQPVLMRPTSLDPPDHNQNFSGLWAAHRPRKDQEIDLYYLNLDNRNPGVAVGRDGVLGGYNVSTFGGRYVGDYRGLLWDFEGMYQFGGWSNQIISAGAATTGLGYQFARLPFNPQFWVYNDWASGTQNPVSGNIHGTFNQLFPWGHTYFGYLDLVGRQNIDDMSMQFGFFPLKWIQTTVQYHIFHLDSARDALYNASGTPIRSDPTGQAGTFVGEEIDFTTNFHLNLHHDIFVGYSKLFAGSFIKNTAGPKEGPALFYLQYSFKW
ncbi:MAG TPA: alginate export family protein [Gemmataceae bacterium]|jgi:hypothetical protein